VKGENVGVPEVENREKQPLYRFEPQFEQLRLPPIGRDGTGGDNE
jgi:hypothetical protein